MWRIELYNLRSGRKVGELVVAHRFVESWIAAADEVRGIVATPLRGRK